MCNNLIINYKYMNAYCSYKYKPVTWKWGSILLCCARIFHLRSKLFFCHKREPDNPSIFSWKKKKKYGSIRFATRLEVNVLCHHSHVIYVRTRRFFFQLGRCTRSGPRVESLVSNVQSPPVRSVPDFRLLQHHLVVIYDGMMSRQARSERCPDEGGPANDG